VPTGGTEHAHHPGQPSVGAARCNGAVASHAAAIQHGLLVTYSEAVSGQPTHSARAPEAWDTAETLATHEPYGNGERRADAIGACTARNSGIGGACHSASWRVDGSVH